jgi:hypothetical protein
VRLERTAVAGLLLAASAAQAAGVYKWVDRGGVTHYDDLSLLAERLTRAGLAKRTITPGETARVPEAFVEAVARQCQDARTRSESTASARSLYARDPAGNAYALSESQAALERARLAHETQRLCRPIAAEKLLAEALQDARMAEAEAVKNAAAAR